MKKLSEAQEKKRKEDQEWQKKNLESFNEISMFPNLNKTKQTDNDMTGLGKYINNENTYKSIPKNNYDNYDRSVLKIK